MRYVVDYNAMRGNYKNMVEGEDEGEGGRCRSRTYGLTAG